MSGRLPGVLFLMLLALPSWGGPLEDALDQLKQLKYGQASKTLEKVHSLRNLSLDEVLRFYELSGIVRASLGDAGRARTSFAKLLRLRPDFALKGRFAPKVTTPFFEAKAISQEQGILRVELEASGFDGTTVTELTLKCRGGEGWVSELILRLDEDGVEREAMMSCTGSQAVKVRSRRVGATVLARDARGWVLLESGLARFEAPEAPPAPAIEAPLLSEAMPSPPLPLVATPTPPLIDKSASPAPLRGLTVGLAVAGGLALTAGAVSAGVNLDLHRRFREKAAVTDEQGLVTGLTRKQALTLEAAAEQAAVIANVGFIAGGALVASAGVTWLIGHSMQAQVALVPGRGAVVSVGGPLP